MSFRNPQRDRGNTGSRGGGVWQNSSSGGGGSKLQDRFKQMTAQEKLIEQKKREIEERAEKDKIKKQEEALKKLHGKSQALPQQKLKS